MTIGGRGLGFFVLLVVLATANGCGIVASIDRSKIDSGADSGPDAETLDAAADGDAAPDPGDAADAGVAD